MTDKQNTEKPEIPPYDPSCRPGFLPTSELVDIKDKGKKFVYSLWLYNSHNNDEMLLASYTDFKVARKYMMRLAGEYVRNGANYSISLKKILQYPISFIKYKLDRDTLVSYRVYYNEHKSQIVELWIE